MTYRVEYSPSARVDLKGIYTHIAFRLKEKRIAENQVSRIRKEIRSLNEMPERYVRVEWEPWASQNTHKLPVDRFVIYYQVDKENRFVLITRILYGGRNLETILIGD